MNGFISFPLMRRFDKCLSYLSLTSAGSALILNSSCVAIGEMDCDNCPLDMSTKSFWNSGVRDTLLLGFTGLGVLSVCGISGCSTSIPHCLMFAGFW